MIDSEYYQNYQGPNLTQVILNGEEDITEKIKVFYGTNNNWQGKLWTYKDVFGDDVNIASRLESLSPPGGICVSNLFLNNIENKIKIKTDYIGLQSFKGVGRLIDVYAINHKTLKRPQLSHYNNENIMIDNDEKPSLILFPFTNKGNKEDDFYAHCLSNDILSDLSNSSDIKIASINELEKLINRKY